jgi:hypothetical protein
MQQTFEYYTVDPGTWKDVKLIKNIKSSSIDRDFEAETLGSATIDIAEPLGECYIRIYLVTIQNGIRERHALGTFLVQTPGSSFDGKMQSVSMDAYTPLLELKENRPPIGYYVPKGDNIMEVVYRLVGEHARAPVVKNECSTNLVYDFVADTSDTWLTFLMDLVANAKYTFMLDELGNIMFSPKQDTASLQPVWTYDDGNSSILYPEINMEHDLYGIPNVVEVIYSNGAKSYHSRVVNDDPNSPISTVSRGREIVFRETDPSLIGAANQYQVDEYATQLLRELSSLENTVTYTHGYCPVRIGDCVRLNYARAGLVNVKAKVIRQSINCVPGCPVTETAVFTTRLWG